MTATQNRTYEEMVDALAEGIPQLENTLSGLSEGDW